MLENEEQEHDMPKFVYYAKTYLVTGEEFSTVCGTELCDILNAAMIAILNGKEILIYSDKV